MNEKLTAYQEKHIRSLSPQWIFGTHTTAAFKKYTAKSRITEQVVSHDSLNGLILAVFKANKSLL